MRLLYFKYLFVCCAARLGGFCYEQSCFKHWQRYVIRTFRKCTTLEHTSLNCTGYSFVCTFSQIKWPMLYDWIRYYMMWMAYKLKSQKISKCIVENLNNTSCIQHFYAVFHAKYLSILFFMLLWRPVQSPNMSWTSLRLFCCCVFYLFFTVVSCMIWEPNSVHKVDMTVMDIGWMIIQRVDKINDTLDYLILGFIFSLLLMCTPVIYRGFHSKDQLENLTYLEIDDYFAVARIGFGHHWRWRPHTLSLYLCHVCYSMSRF